METRANKEKIKSYVIDINADGSKETIEVEDRFLTDTAFVLTVKNRRKEVIDSLCIPGKIRKLELIDLNDNGQKQMLVYFDGVPDLSNIIIYQLKNNKLYKIFAIASEYGVDARFDTIPRIKVGKPSKSNNSSNFLPDWDSWVWVGDKFIRE